MLPLKAPGFSRAFYLAAMSVWTAAVALMFITAVWGGFQGLMNRLVRIEESRQTAQPLPGAVMQGDVTVGHLTPNPFAGPLPSSADVPAGWVVQEVVKGGDVLEIRADKLFVKEPAAPPQAQVHAQAKPQPAPRAPEPRAPERPPLTAGELGVIRSVKFEPGQDHFLMSVMASATPESTGFFYLDNPRRLAVNIKGAWRNAAPRSTEFSTGPIARVNIGEHPDYVRITLLFRDPGAPKPKDPVLTKVKDGLQVSLATK